MPAIDDIPDEVLYGRTKKPLFAPSEPTGISVEEMAADYEKHLPPQPRQRRGSAAGAMHAAKWAETFYPSGNAAQRRQYDEDIAEGIAVQQEMEAAELQRELGRSKVAQDLYFRGEDLKLKRAESAAELQIKQQAFEQNRAMFPEKLQAQKMKFELDATRERAAVASEKRRMMQERRMLEQTDALEEYIEGGRTNGLIPGTPEYRDYALEGLRKFPFGAKELAVAIKEESKIDPDLLPSAKIQAAREERLASNAEINTAQKEREYWRKERTAQLAIAKDAKGADKEIASMRARTAQKKLSQLERLDITNPPDDETGPAPSGSGVDPRQLAQDAPAQAPERPSGRRKKSATAEATPSATAPTASQKTASAPAPIRRRNAATGEVWLYDPTTKRPIGKE